MPNSMKITFVTVTFNYFALVLFFSIPTLGENKDGSTLPTLVRISSYILW